MSDLKSFFAALNHQEEGFKQAIYQDRLGLIMRCAISELDWYQYNYSRAKSPTEEQQKQFYILQVGAARLVQLSLEAHESFELPVITMKRHRDLTIRVLQIASGLGMIQHGRRVAQSVAHGVGSIDQIDSNEFVVTLPKEVEDEDFYERELTRYYNSESRRLFAEATLTDTWLTLSEEVTTLLHDLVQPFREHYIGYDADPVLDNYFYGLAMHELSLQQGYDTYHCTTSFGGIRMQSYVVALTYLVSISIRHERFAEALVRKAPKVKLENVLTISADLDPFVESLCDAVNYFGSRFDNFSEISLAEARQIFDILSIGRGNTKLIDAPGAPYPLLVKCSESGVIRSSFGAWSEPMRFLLESLRFHFPQDYDKNQINREGSLQRATRRILDDCFSDLDYRENVAMRIEGRVISDIDLVVIDKINGTILLCQLKHQELFGHDIHARAVRSKRLCSQVGDWLTSLEKWRAHVGVGGILASLQLPKSMARGLVLYQVVISRHFAFPLKSIVTGVDKAFANWNQLYNSVEIVRSAHLIPTLLDLVQVLQETQAIPKTMTHLEEPRSKWCINELTFVTQQQ
jgi:hypothetical protein